MFPLLKRDIDIYGEQVMQLVLQQTYFNILTCKTFSLPAIVEVFYIFKAQNLYKITYLIIKEKVTLCRMQIIMNTEPAKVKV